jgi:hypothetical protein
MELLNWQDELYTKTLNDELVGLERRCRTDLNCTIEDIEGTLKQLYFMQGADWLGRGEVQDITLSATIAAHEEFIAEHKST